MQPRDPDYAARVAASFQRQAFMQTLDARLVRVAPGEVDIELAYDPRWCQQHGFFHGGVISTLADNAGGYAAFSLMRAEDSVLTVEYKLNFVAPGKGERLLAAGRVIRPGRTLTVCDARVYGVTGKEQTLCATALCTLMTLADTPDEPAAVPGNEDFPC